MMNDMLFKQLKEHKPIIINYGKGIITDDEIKEVATYDEEIQKYRSETGIWSNKLLREILEGKIENIKIELESE